MQSEENLEDWKIEPAKSGHIRLWHIHKYDGKWKLCSYREDIGWFCHLCKELAPICINDVASLKGLTP